MSKLLALLFIAVPLFAHAAAEPDVIAEINGKKLTKEEFDRRYKEQIAFFRYGAPTKAAVLNDIINFELAVQEAKKEGIDQDPDVIEHMNTVLYQALVEKRLADKFKGAVDVTEDEAKSYCKKNPAVRVKHIFVPLKPAALKAEEEEANQKIKVLQSQLASGKKFDDVVKNNPDQGPSATSAGDTGYASKLQLDPAIYAEARKLSTGEVAKKPVRSQLGLHIVKLIGVQDCNTINIPEWQRMVFDEKRTKIFQDYLSGLRSKGHVSINEEAVKE